MRRSPRSASRESALSSTAQLQRTRVEDPISGEHAQLVRLLPRMAVERRCPSRPRQILLRLRHVNDRDRFTFFRTDEFDTNFNGGPYGTAFVEYRPRARNDHHARPRQCLRYVGQPPSSAVPFPTAPTRTFVIDEFRERNRHLNFGLTLKQTFGGAEQRGVAQATLAPLKGGRDTHTFLRRHIVGEPAILPFDWADPFDLNHQLTDEERMVRDTAESYAQDKLQPRVTEAYLEREFRPRDPARNGRRSACSARPSRTNMAAPASAMSAMA